MNKDSITSNPCAVCGETKPELFKIWFDGHLKLYRCLRCGFVSQFSGPGRIKIMEDHFPEGFLNGRKDFLYAKRRCALQNIVNHIVSIKAEGKILDVGCGDGHFLYLCAQKGLNCYGVEAIEPLASFASSMTGTQITNGNYNKEMFPENSFDIITFIQVLEHIATPIDFLETVKYHLRPNGIIVIEVPSIRSPHFLLYEWTGIKKFAAPKWGQGVIYNHFAYYSPNSLKTLIEKCGFKCLLCSTGRWKYKYSGVLGSVGRMIDPLLNKLKVGGILLIAD